MAKEIIFTTDDFGWAKKINEGIALAYEHGPITEISMSINAPQVTHALDSIKSKNNIGLHFNLTKFKPVSKHNINSLIDRKTKEFRSIKNSDELYRFLTSAKISEINEEIYAQFDLFKELVDRNPSHITSHHGIHGDPKVLNIVIDIAKKYKIPVRLPVWMSATNGFVSNYAAEATLRRNGIKTTNKIFINIFNDDLRETPMPLIDDFANSIEKMPNGLIEVGCHVGFMDKEVLFSSSLNWQRVKDLIALIDPSFMELLRKNKLKLVNWRGIEKKYTTEKGIIYAKVNYMRR
jgi:predicted glycoside hydrolase/deacetylase ChbG (UPF0249 family)